MNEVPQIILGAHGQVGGELQRELQRLGRNAIAADREGDWAFDLTDPKSVAGLFERYAREAGGRPTVVYLPAAATNVDQCEREPDACYAVNVHGPEAVAKECLRQGHQLVFYSTEYVFGGAEYEGGAVGPFSETDPPAPTSVYGKSKLDAELALGALATPTFTPLLLRTTVVFSYAPQGLNFAMQIFRYLQKIFAEGGKAPDSLFKIASDQISTPTYAPALAQASVALAEKHAGGVYNVVGADLLSREQFVKKLALTFGFDWQEAQRYFQCMPTKEISQVARRPLTAGLTTDKLSAAGVKVWSLDEALADFVGKMRH